MPVRITALIKKLPSISTEEFHKYWSESHPSVFLSVPIVQRNLTKYQQFHVDATVSSSLKSAGIAMAEFDGGAEFWASSYEEAMAVFQDEEYHRIVVPDEIKFLDREAAVMMVGHEEVKWEDGKAAPGVVVELHTK